MRCWVQLASESEFVRSDWVDIELGRRKTVNDNMESKREWERELTEIITQWEQWVVWKKNAGMGVWSVFQNTQAITQPVRAASHCSCPLFSPLLSLRWSSSAMIRAATRLFLILSLSGYLLTFFSPRVALYSAQMPNTQYIVHEGKEVSAPQIPRRKRRSFFLKDQTDKLVVRTPLTCC